MKNITSSFPDRLMDLIADKKQHEGLSLADVAKKIGVSSGALSKYQNGAAEPGINALVKMADYFDVSFDYLLGHSNNKRRNNVDIGKELGLSDQAIRVLRRANTFSKKGDSIETSYLATINYLLESEIALREISRYLGLNYDSNAKIYCHYYAATFEQNTSPDFKPDGKYIAFPENIWANMHLAGIQSELIKLRETLKQKEDASNGSD